MPLAPPVIKIVLLLSFIIKYPGKFSHGIVFHAVPRRSLCSAEASAVKSDPPAHRANPVFEPPSLWRDLSLKLLHGADPPWVLDDCESQGPDPSFKPLCLHHHHLAVVGAERNSRHTLKGGEQMDPEFS